MNWQETYRNRLTTAEKAVSHIKSGDRVVIGHAAGEPQGLIRTMAANKENCQMSSFASARQE